MSDIPNLQFGNQASNIMQSQSNLMGQNPRGNMFQPNIFMQPIGNIYNLNNSSEIGNVPVGSGVSVGLCLPEGAMYLKSMQSNGPALLAYKLIPIGLENNNVQTQSAQPAPQAQETGVQQIEKLLREYGDKIEKLERQINNLTPQDKGGKAKWEI